MKVLKAIPTLIICFILCLGGCLLLSGCSPASVEEIAEGVTEGIIDEIKEYTEHGHKKR